MTKAIKLEITSLSPLAIGKKKPGSVSEAEDYIRGSVIRGAIASYLLRLGESLETGDDFHKLFIDENAAIFTNAYPAPHLLPATAVSAKAKSGFQPKGNGVFDTLIDRFCAENYGLIYNPTCPQDSSRVEPYGGFYQQQGQQYQSKSVSKRLLTRTGINRRRGTSEEEILYTIEVLNEYSTKKDEERVTYFSTIFLEDENLAQDLTRFFNQIDLRLGGSASRGLGKVAVKAQLEEENPNINTPIQQFNQLLQSRWQQWSIFSFNPPEFPKRVYFTINLESDGIFTENWQRTTVISETMLTQAAQIEDKSLRLETAYSSYDYCSGWNYAWGLKKDLELITQKGGVYLYSTENIDLWLEPLAKLAWRGIGNRNLEGFGQISICNPFHLILRENAV